MIPMFQEPESDFLMKVALNEYSDIALSSITKITENIRWFDSG